MTCLSCGHPIPPERLRAMPLAEFCVACKTAQEEADEKKGRIQSHQIHEAMAVVEIDPSEIYGWGR